MEEKQKGGKRDNAGRKPSDDKKLPITVYIETSFIQKNGGKIELARRIVDIVKADFVTNPIMDRIKENNTPENKARILQERNQVKATNPETDTNQDISYMEELFQKIKQEKK
jgi:hypothetical protein